VVSGDPDRKNSSETRIDQTKTISIAIATLPLLIKEHVLVERRPFQSWLLNYYLPLVSDNDRKNYLFRTNIL
jgi:hypothetical protein